MKEDKLKKELKSILLVILAKDAISEADKIRCGKKAVEAMGTKARFEAVDNYEQFMNRI